MIWGALSCSGASGLYFIPPKMTMNGPEHMELLREKMKLHIHGSMPVLHDWCN